MLALPIGAMSKTHMLEQEVTQVPALKWSLQHTPNVWGFFLSSLHEIVHHDNVAV